VLQDPREIGLFGFGAVTDRADDPPGDFARLAAHRFVIEIQRPADRGRADSLVPQGMDLLPPLPSQLGPPPIDHWGRWFGLGDGLSGGLLVQALAMRAHHLVDCDGEVLEQVKPVGDLDGVRCAESGAF
jgi:hypothetical protein